MAIKIASITNETKLSLWDVDETLQRLAGNHSLVATIATMFVAQIELKASALRDAVARHDAEAISFASHTIKGSSGDIGAVALHKLAAKIELLAKANQLALIDEHMKLFDETVAATVNTIQQELPKLGASS